MHRRGLAEERRTSYGGLTVPHTASSLRRLPGPSKGKGAIEVDHQVQPVDPDRWVGRRRFARRSQLPDHADAASPKLLACLVGCHAEQPRSQLELVAQSRRLAPETMPSASTLVSYALLARGPVRTGTDGHGPTDTGRTWSGPVEPGTGP